MPAPSQERTRAVYCGRACIGFIAVVADGFYATMLDGAGVGVFATQREAADALQAAHGKPVETRIRG